jgi:hypothetical protein
LLAPRVIQAAGVEAVEAELVYRLDRYGLGRSVVAGHGQRDPAWGASGFAERQQVLGKDVVECLDHWVTEVSFGPAALDGGVLDLLDLPVALLFCGMATITTLAPWLTSVMGTGAAPVSAASSANLSGPVELATETLCPVAVSRRVRVPPILPAPMIPILMVSSSGAM